MKRPLEVLDVDALLEDDPEAVFEVEFSDEEGRTYAELTRPAGQLIALRYSPAVA